MGNRAHVHTKHEIEYGEGQLNWCRDLIGDWLRKNGVSVYETSNDGVDATEWELDKGELRDIPESAYTRLRDYGGEEITASELRAFIQEMLNTPTGEYVYVSWF